MRIGSLSRGLCLAIAAVFAASPATATNIVTFSVPGVATVEKDQVLSIAVDLLFGDLTLGGGFDLVLSPALSFDTFDFDPGFADDPAFRLTPVDGATAGPFTIAFGSFSGLIGDRRIGTLRLIANEALTLGAGPLVLSAVDNAVSAGPFVDTLGGTLAVQYDGLLGTVVPEPSTLLLLGASLAGVGGFRRRQPARASYSGSKATPRWPKSSAPGQSSSA